MCKDTRVHYAVLKIRTEQEPAPRIRARQAQAVQKKPPPERLSPQDPTACSSSQALKTLVPRPASGERTDRAITRQPDE